MIALQNSSLNDLLINFFGSLYCGFWKPCKDKFYFQHVSLSLITLGEILTMTPRSTIVPSLLLLFEILLNQLNQDLFLLLILLFKTFQKNVGYSFFYLLFALWKPAETYFDSPKMTSYIQHPFETYFDPSKISLNIQHSFGVAIGGLGSNVFIVNFFFF